MPMEDYPSFREEADGLWHKAQERLQAFGGLDKGEQESLAEFLAGVYEKAREVEFAVSTFASGEQPADWSEMADLLAFAEIASGLVVVYHQESQDTLIQAIDRLRAGQSTQTKKTPRGASKRPE